MRPSRVVVRAALIAVLATVAVPGTAGSRAPARETALDAIAFRPVGFDGPAGTLMSTPPPTGSGRSAGILQPKALLTELPLVVEPAPRPVVDQPAAPVIVVGARNFDADLSWYGPGFYGQRTACGETLTTSLIGVANRTLPCGTLITFQDPFNGRTLTVPVVDRGPYVAGRIWDLTGGACLALDHCWTGAMWWKYG